MSDETPSGRVLLRVVSVSTSLHTTLESAGDPPRPPTQVVQAVLWPAWTNGYDVLGGQKISLHFSDPNHPLLAHIGIDQVFELKPLEVE